MLFKFSKSLHHFSIARRNYKEPAQSIHCFISISIIYRLFEVIHCFMKTIGTVQGHRVVSDFLDSNKTMLFINPLFNRSITHDFVVILSFIFLLIFSIFWIYKPHCWKASKIVQRHTLHCSRYFWKYQGKQSGKSFLYWFHFSTFLIRK